MWLKTEFGIEAVAVRELDLVRSEDPDIFAAARVAADAVMTKDRDFVELVERLGRPRPKRREMLVRLAALVLMVVGVAGAGSPLHAQRPRANASNSLAAAERAGQQAAEHPDIAGHFLAGAASGATIGAALLFRPAAGLGVLGLFAAHGALEPATVPLDAVPVEVTPEWRAAFEAGYRKRLADRRRSAVWGGAAMGIVTGLWIVTRFIPPT